MAQKNDSYPSPTAAQAGSGVSPYQQNHQDPAQDALDLNAELQVAAVGGMQSPPQHHHHEHHENHPRPPIPYTQQSLQATMTAFANDNRDPYAYAQAQASTPQPYQGTIPGISGPSSATPDDALARKKSKVTRACDECRRKKIKCDAESDGPNAPRCSNCQRTNAECKFSRAPQKRGPSKGYIKELSDRVAQLESTRVAGAYSSDMDTGSPMPLGPMGSDRKRTYSMAETNFLNSSDSPILDKYRSEGPKTFAPVAIAPEAQMQLPSRGSTKPKSLGIELAIPENAQIYPMKALNPVDERNMQEFIAKTNRVFPLLGSRDGINTNLQYCIPPLRSAFYYAIGSVVATVEPSSGELTRSQCFDTVKGSMGPLGPLSETAHPLDPFPYQARLVRLQILLLLILHNESSGPPHEDPFGSFTTDQLLLQARRLIDDLQLRHVTEAAHLGPVGDTARAFSTARRAFWVFVVLDIWHSLGTRAPRLLTLMSVEQELGPQDRTLLGEEYYAFVRRSSFAAALSDQLKSERVQSSDVATTGYFVRNMLLATFADAGGAGNVKAQPLAALAYGTIDLLCAMCCAGPSACPPTPMIIDAAGKLTNLLANVELPEGIPLAHHFVVPAVHALVRVVDYPMQREVAKAGLQDLLHVLRSKGILDGSSWREPVTTMVLEKLEEEKMGDSRVENGVMPVIEAGVEGVEWKTDWPRIVWKGYLRGPLWVSCDSGNM